MSGSADQRHRARKRLAHRIKAAVYAAPGIDSALDAAFGAEVLGPRGALREHAYLRLFPERRLRASPFPLDAPGAPPGHVVAASSADANRAVCPGTLTVLSLVPPEDSAGASRPAQLAAELHRRGWRVSWLHALPIFPWPKLRRPKLARVEVRHILDGDLPADSATRERSHLVVIEAPHPALMRAASLASASARVVYDVIDDWTGELGHGWYDPRVEEAIVARAHVLTGSARLLCDDLSARAGRSVEYLPNAVDARLFDPTETWIRPADLRVGSPTIVYVGALWGEWVDLALVEAVARALPRAAVHLIGPAGSRSMPSAPNVHLLGPRPREIVPAYLAGADLTLIPFVKSRLTDATSPLKLFEALAMGTPVVSTPLREMESVPGVILAAGVDATVSAIRRSAAAPPPVAEMRAFAARHTWSVRIDRLLDLLQIEQ